MRTFRRESVLPGPQIELSDRAAALYNLALQSPGRNGGFEVQPDSVRVNYLPAGFPLEMRFATFWAPGTLAALGFRGAIF